MPLISIRSLPGDEFQHRVKHGFKPPYWIEPGREGRMADALRTASSSADTRYEALLREANNQIQELKKQMTFLQHETAKEALKLRTQLASAGEHRERIKTELNQTLTELSQIRETVNQLFHYREHYFHIRGKIQTLIRIRPHRVSTSTSSPTNHKSYTVEPPGTLVMPRPNDDGPGSTFNFDIIMPPSFSPAISDIPPTLTSTIVPLLDAALAGHMITIFAYGRSGTGKTHTTTQILSLVKSHLFTPTSRQVKAHYTTLYLSIFHDLLSTPPNSALPMPKGSSTIPLPVPGSTSIPVTTPSDLDTLLATANRHLTVTSTALNPSSSRSHSFLSLALPERGGIVNIIDLAGHENTKASQVTGLQAKEALAINTSLSQLGNCFLQLKGGKSESGKSCFREGPLPRVFGTCLGYGPSPTQTQGKRLSRVLMVATVALDDDDGGVVGDLETLKYAEFAAGVMLNNGIRRSDLKW